MSTSFLMTLQPLEPYFFGNEKTFSFDPKTPAETRYFIKSERMPSQTTLLGTLRYAMMPVKNASFQYNEQDILRNAAIVGAESFQIEKKEQSFGAIEQLSPVFLMHGGKIHIRTPYDHIVRESVYAPFRNYMSVTTDQGTQWITKEYRSKDGLADSFMELETGKIVPNNDIFRTHIHVGVNKTQDAKAFFKKQFSTLTEGWAFAAYVQIDTERVASDPAAAAVFEALQTGIPAYLGQGKSTFILRLTPEKNTLKEQIMPHLHPNALYCLSDTFTEAQNLTGCLFAAITHRDYREFVTSFHNDNSTLYGRIAKRELLYKLIGSGSIFLMEDPSALYKRLTDPHLQMIGMNFCVINKED